MRTRTAIIGVATTAAFTAGLVQGTAGAAEASPAQPAPVQPAVAQAAIECDTGSSGQNATFYDGESASYTYDERFGNGPEIPGTELDTHTPQGATTWSDWDGNGNDLLLVAAYGRSDEDAHLIGITPGGNHVGTVAVAESHVGGIAVSNGWAFVQGRNSTDWETVRKYRLSELRTAMTETGIPYLAQTGSARNVYGADFMTAHDGYLWSGQFDSGGRDKMYSYRINDDGSLTTQAQAYEVPRKTQGLMVTDGHFVYSTSYGRGNRSNVYVVERGEPDLDQAPLHCFRAPSMSEGITEHGGEAHLVFESAAHRYRDDPDTRNVIPDLHTAPVSDLVALVD
ncbi:hypothetical protein [Parasphingorhabdus pacifica]